MSANPLKLKRNTHVLAKNHLRRFANNDGTVFVYNRHRGLVQSLSFDVEGLFNVRGVWSDHAENQMERIEEAFWLVLNEIDSAGESVNLDDHQHAISEYFALWHARAEYILNVDSLVVDLHGIERRDLKCNLEDGKLDVTSHQKDGRKIRIKATPEDFGESRGVSFYSTEVKASARSASWPVIRWLMDQCNLDGIRWGLVGTLGALVLPDRITRYFDIPIGPSLMLHGYGAGQVFQTRALADAADVDDWNRAFFCGAMNAVAAQSSEPLERLLAGHSSQA